MPSISLDTSPKGLQSLRRGLKLNTKGLALLLSTVSGIGLSGRTIEYWEQGRSISGKGMRALNALSALPKPEIKRLVKQIKAIQAAPSPTPPLTDPISE